MITGGPISIRARPWARKRDNDVYKLFRQRVKKMFLLSFLSEEYWELKGD